MGGGQHGVARSVKTSPGIVKEPDPTPRHRIGFNAFNVFNAFNSFNWTLSFPPVASPPSPCGVLSCPVLPCPAVPCPVWSCPSVCLSHDHEHTSTSRPARAHQHEHTRPSTLARAHGHERAHQRGWEGARVGGSTAWRAV